MWYPTRQPSLHRATLQVRQLHVEETSRPYGVILPSWPQFRHTSFFDIFNEIVSREMRWFNDRHLDTSTSGTLATRESTDQLADDLRAIFEMCHVVLFMCE